MAELKLRKNEKGMILAIDMGNTNIVIGCVDDKKVLFEERLSTDYSKTELEYAIGFKTVLEIYNKMVNQELFETAVGFTFFFSDMIIPLIFLIIVICLLSF